jgi:hypothetical protein
MHLFSLCVLIYHHLFEYNDYYFETDGVLFSLKKLIFNIFS